MVKEITAQTLHEWLNDADVLLVDVREPNEYAHGYINKAVHIPLAQVTFDKLPLTGKRKIIFQCRSGKRSQLACDAIADDLPESMEMYSLEGGILSWGDAGYPITMPGQTCVDQAHTSCALKCAFKCPLPFTNVHQRICFIAGLLLIIFMILSATVSSTFVIGLFATAIGLIIAAFKKVS